MLPHPTGRAAARCAPRPTGTTAPPPHHEEAAVLRRVFALVVFSVYPAAAAAQPAAWGTYAGDAQHTALSGVGSQPLQAIRWQTAVDLAPQYSGNDLLIHYGSPVIS